MTINFKTVLLFTVFIVSYFHKKKFADAKIRKVPASDNFFRSILNPIARTPVSLNNIIHVQYNYRFGVPLTNFCAGKISYKKTRKKTTRIDLTR